MTKRREFLQTAVLASSALMLSATPLRGVLAQSGMEKINATTGLFTGTGANVLVKKAGNGQLLVVDGGLSAQARDLRKNIERSMDSKKFALLVNTHWHPEQTGLNTELGNRRTTIFAHENTRQWLSTDVKRLWEDNTIPALAESARPNETFYHYGSMPIGGESQSESMEYGLLRQAHTDGDMFVFLPQDNVLHAGGVIASDGWPFMDWWTGGWVGGIVNAIETLLDIADDNTVIIPATGPAINKAELVQMHAMYGDIFEQVRGMFVKANTVEQTVAAKPAAKYEARFGNADKFIELCHWSLIPHLTPDA